MKKKSSNRAIVWTLGLIVSGSLLAVWCSADAWGNEVAGQVVKAPTWEDYAVIVNQNMFSKNRTPPPDPTRPTVRPPDPNAESFYVLRGITSENGVFQVFLQDNRQGVVVQKRAGDEVARGKIKAVLGLDSIEFQMGDTIRTIQMGYNLEGNQGGTSTREAASVRPPPGSEPRPGPGDMRANDMQGGRSRQQRFGFDTGFNRSSFGSRRDRGMGTGMGMNMGGAPSGPNSTTSSSSGTLSGASTEEILQRLMAQRQQQLGQAPPASDQNQQQPEQDQQQSGSDQQ
jgi:hypothetical protein